MIKGLKFPTYKKLCFINQLRKMQSCQQENGQRKQKIVQKKKKKSWRSNSLTIKELLLYFLTCHIRQGKFTLLNCDKDTVTQSLILLERVEFGMNFLEII